MARSKLETSIRQQQIVQAALDIVADYGPKALSMARVASRLGLVPSAIYRHFAGKDAMLDAAMDLVGRKLMDNVTAATGLSDDPMQQLRELLLRHIRMIRENIAIPRVVFSEDALGARAERKARARGILTGYLGAVAGIVEGGQAQGAIRRDLDARTAALIFMGLILPAGILWHMTDGKFDVTRHAERAWRIFSRAMSPR
ncbi:MAG: TetR/AcrR family transcriptional regulator [Phycisphaerae bacterium]